MRDNYLHNQKAECALINRCKQGDRDAFRELFITHSDHIQRIVIRMGFNRDMREDILQEVAKKILLKIGKFDGKSRFSTWVYRITVNTALEIYRKEKRYRNSIINEESFAADQYTDKDYEKQEIRRSLLLSVKQLPPRQKKCALLFYFAELSVSEIASSLFIKENAVKAALFKARKNLAAQLRKKRFF